MRTITTDNDHGALAATDDHVALIAAENDLIATAPQAALTVADARYREACRAEADARAIYAAAHVDRQHGFARSGTVSLEASRAELEARRVLVLAHARAFKARARLVAAGGHP